MVPRRVETRTLSPGLMPSFSMVPRDTGGQLRLDGVEHIEAAQRAAALETVLPPNCPEKRDHFLTSMQGKGRAKLRVIARKLIGSGQGFNRQIPLRTNLPNHVQV